MGSSGGFFVDGRTSIEERVEQQRRAEEKAAAQAFDAQVAEFMRTQLAQYNNRDADGARRLLDKIISQLSDDMEASLDLLFGGSIAKHTYVDGLSDIDALVLLKKTDVSRKSPRDLLQLFADILASKFGRKAVEVGTLAVTVNVEGKSVQLLPATREGEGFRIPSWDGKNWSRIDPRKFAEMLTATNERLGNKLVPMIKLAKAVISTLPEQQRLIGYHTECLAVDIFRKYNEEMTTKAMLRHFFVSAPNEIITPTPDPTGQSTFVDEYLGAPGSLERRICADALGRIARKIRNADGAKSIQMWQEIMGTSDQ